MSKTEFLTTYLREIGVQTPVPLVHLDHYTASKKDAAKLPKKKNPIDTNHYGNLGTMSLQAIKCQDCKLSESRQHAVFGQGNAHADLLFITDPPNENEDQQGKCMIGQDASMFDAMLAAISLQRQSIYTLSIVQCSPPNHRDPTSNELFACQQWLNGQVDMISPKVICVMGRIAAQALLKSNMALHDLRGQWHHYRGIAVRVSYPPIYLLRSPKNKSKIWQDLLAIQAHLA
ncbi:MAG: uracil-DNA glycosylase [Mariprofundaceae bacterium]|nr:uracil-DNA glycosylase [Mariprofundaceae bacterium]